MKIYVFKIKLFNLKLHLRATYRRLQVLKKRKMFDNKHNLCIYLCIFMMSLNFLKYTNIFLSVKENEKIEITYSRIYDFAWPHVAFFGAGR